MSGNVKCNTEKSNLKPPDYCTSICCRGNDSYCKDCSHALWYGSATVNGKLWHWEFNPRFGHEAFRAGVVVAFFEIKPLFSGE